MKKTTTFLTILFLVSVSTVYSEPMANRKKLVATPVKNKNIEKSKKYSLVQIDKSLLKLSREYNGNNPKTIYTAIQNIRKSAVKDEFETTEQFQQRSAKEYNLPVIGQINLNGLFAFLSEMHDIEYSADASEFSLNITLSNVVKPPHYNASDNYKENAKAMPLLTERVGYGSYTATNSFGAKTLVEERIYEYYFSAIVNYHDFPFKKTTNTLLGYEEWSMVSKFKAKQDEAKTIKDNVRVLLIAKLDEPLIYEKSSYEEPTINKPKETTSNYRYIFLKLEEIWIYNQVTGQIYSKINKLQARAAEEKGREGDAN